MRHVSGFLTRLLGVALLLLSVACENSGSGTESGTDVLFGPPADPNGSVCDPFTGSNTNLPTQGIEGSLYYLSQSQPAYTSIVDYLQFGHLISDITLYFNQLFIPTRPFDRGFYTLAGSLITDDDGNSLYEYFALDLRGRLKLKSGDPAGAYQLGILSDDGSVLKIDDGTGSRVLIDNDGTHPTKFMCATEPVNFTASTKLPFEVQYFQGPRFHISLIVMWRPWPILPADVNDPECGQQGNWHFFDSTQDPPAPQTAYNDMLARGWQPIAPANFLLPEQAEPNPCNEPAPIISNFFISSITKTSVTVTWTTDRAANSQITLTNAGTGAIITSPLSAALVTSHSVTVTGLTANTLYRAVAISASISGASTSSTAQLFRTAR